MEPSTLLPYYFSSFTKLSLCRSILIKFSFFIEEALWKMGNNEGVMYKVPLCMLVFTNLS